MTTQRNTVLDEAIAAIRGEMDREIQAGSCYTAREHLVIRQWLGYAAEAVDMLKQKRCPKYKVRAYRRGPNHEAKPRSGSAK